MNEIRKYRVALTLIAAGVVTVGLIYGYYIPGHSQVKNKQAEMASLQQEIDGLTQFLQAADAANHFAALQANERAATLTELYAIDSLEAFIADFSIALEDMGLTGIHVAPVIEELLNPPTVELDGIVLARLKFEVTVQGLFIDGGQAIEQMEQQRYFVAIPHLEIEHDDSIAPEVVWNFQILAYLRTGEHRDG